MRRDEVAALAAGIGELDPAAQTGAALRQDQLTKPPGALGRLEALSIWLAGVQGRCPPDELTRKRLVVFAADHGVAAQGVSAYPAEVTAQMVGNFLDGGAACNVLARSAGVTVRVVDVAVDADPDWPAEVGKHKVRRGSGAIHVEPALTEGELSAALGAGAAIADEEIDAGADLLVVGDMGIGNTTPTAAVVAAVTGADPADVVGRGTGIDDGAWARKVALVREALRRSSAGPADPLTVLAEVGGADLAAMTGFLLAAAARRTPVVLDGVVSGAAALVAAQLAPRVTHFCVAGHRSTEPAHRRALEHLGLDPLLDLSLRLGEGTGALLAVPLLDAAVAVLRDMATFGEAGVSTAT